MQALAVSMAVPPALTRPWPGFLPDSQQPSFVDTHAPVLSWLPRGTPSAGPWAAPTSVMTVPVSRVTALTLKSLLRKLSLKTTHFLGVFCLNAVFLPT